MPTLLLTRPEASAQAFAATLSPDAMAAVRLIFAPLMEIVGIGKTPMLGPDDAVIFTSQNGVRFAPEGQGRLAFCVGQQTTQAAIARGWKATQAGNTAKELIVNLSATSPETKLLHLGGEHTIGDIARSLSANGIETQHIAIYKQKLLPLGPTATDALTGCCIVPVFSPRSALQLAEKAGGCLGNAHLIALSKAVAAPLSGESVAGCIILPAPEANYMRKAVENLCLSLGLP